MQTLNELYHRLERCNREIAACCQAQDGLPQEQKWMALLGEIDWREEREQLLREIALLSRESAA